MRRIVSLLFLTTIICLVTLFSRLSDAADPKPRKIKTTDDPTGSEYFIRQRMWPEENISQQNYLNAFRSAERVLDASLDDPPNWIQAGPTNICGRVTDLVGHPTQTQVFYVGAASGGVFKTVDGGNNWIPIFDFAPTLSVGALAMDNAHPDTLYVGTGEANSSGLSYFGSGVYKTVDGGVNWTYAGLEATQYISRIVIDPFNTQSVWVAAMGELFTTNTERGIYHSADGGMTWDRVLFINDSTGASDVVLDPEDSQIVYAAMWQRILNPQNRVASGRGSGILKSTNGGETWIRLQDGLPQVSENIGRIGLAVSQSSSNVLYASIYNQGNFSTSIYRSTNFGESWIQTNDGSIANIGGDYGWYFGNIRVRPDNSEIVFVLGVNIARSANGGQTWTIIDNGAHIDNHALWFRPSSPANMLLGNDGGVYASATNGNSWIPFTGLPISQLYAATIDYQHPERRLGGTQDNGTLITENGNPSSYEQIFDGDGFYTLVDPTNSNIIYAEYQYGVLGRSMNNGEDWEIILNGIDESERTNWCTPVIMSPNNPQVLYYGAERLYRTENRGNSWHAISPDLTDGGGNGNLPFGTITTIGISPLDPNIIFCGTDDANLWVSVDGGFSWQNRSAGLPNRWITRVTPSPFHSDVCYVTLSGFQVNDDATHLYRTDNYGLNWQNINGGLPLGPLNDVLTDPLFYGQLYAASDFGAYFSPDEGNHWFNLGENLPRVPVIDLVYHPSRLLLAATYGRSMFTTNLLELAVNHPPQITQTIPVDFDTITVNQTLNFLVVANDLENDAISYRWLRNGTEISTENTAEVTFLSANTDELVTATVSDGSYSSSYHWRFRVSNTQEALNPTEMPSEFALLSCYPNPFNISTRIKYYLPKQSTVNISVYDITGRKVTVLFDEVMPVGEAAYDWVANDLSSGVYLLKLSAGTQTLTRKIFLLK